MRDIYKAIEEHKNFLKEKGYNEDQLLGVFAYGSMNYNLFTRKSDVDTKAIYIPNLDNLVLHPMKTKELHLDNDEHCEIMDIRHLVDNFKKQNINFIEILFTEYKWINPKFEHIWKIYFELLREQIARYDINKCVQSICGQAIHTLKQNPGDGKKVSNGLRLKYFLEHYLDGINYIDCIQPTDKYSIYLKKIKYNFENFSYLVNVENLINWFEKARKNKYTEWYNKDFISEKMDQGIMDLVKKVIGYNYFFFEGI